MRLNACRRSGTTAVECALVYPTVFLFTLGLIVGAAGIFRYQEVSSLARRAARYASVHGWQYSKDTGYPAVTPDDIYNNAILPNAIGMDLSKLTYSVSYASGNGQTVTRVVNGVIIATTNTVTVTVSYQWVPEGFLGGITLSSTSVMPMSY
ncbi:MAG TPA: TadE family protein [Gemmataceae bacterium]|nr:TadE family protein [Gemmataceae bacterium]